MYCARCGSVMDDAAASCLQCGQAAAPSAVAAAGAAPQPGAAPVAAQIAYAGFWLRFVAYIIDALIFSAVVLILMVPVVPFFFHRDLPVAEPAAVSAFVLFLTWTCILSLGGVWIYYAVFESSAWQATPGKRVLGLYVCDLQGRRISFARATGRFFAKILSSVILYIGFVMAGFTARKQALHDIVADCLVLRRL